jgi:hypothetical protein
MLSEHIRNPAPQFAISSFFDEAAAAGRDPVNSCLELGPGPKKTIPEATARSTSAAVVALVSSPPKIKLG